MTGPRQRATPEDQARQRFEGETAEHEMSVLRDDGLYRHLRFQKPGTSIYYFDLVTWPGYLAIVGDADDYLFSRVRDMFEFFEGDGERINPQYWAEKLQGPGHDTARRYSEESYRRQVGEWVNEVCRALPHAASGLGDPTADSLRDAANDQLLNEDVIHYEDGVRAALRDFEHGGITVGDYWEWDLREYDFRFLWCCWAILWGIRQYREAQVPA